MLLRLGHFILATVFLLSWAMLFATPAASREVCYTFGAAQFAGATHYCVSSVLAPQGANSYGPENLGDGNLSTAWCEGVKGNGLGETVTIRIDDGAAFRRLLISNGYGKSRQSFFNNSRPHLVEITTDRTPPSRVELVDQNGILPVPLVDAKPFKWVKLKILSVYPGQKYSDTCIGFVTPDFEYEEALLQQRQQVTKAAPSVPAPAAVQRSDVASPAPPTKIAANNAVCMKSGETVKGRLVSRHAQKADGKWVQVFFVGLDEPGCAILDDGSQAQEIRLVQLMPSALDDFLFMKNATPGQPVSVSGRFEASKLQWHMGEVLLFEPKIKSK